MWVCRRVVKPTHSIPLVRLMVYGWQPTVSHSDFAGILNANALYSFTVGFPQVRSRGRGRVTG